MKRYGKRIDKIRTEINQSIIEMLHKHGYNYEVTICIDDTPLLQEDFHDANDSFTLDCVGIRNGDVYFEGSSCCEDITLFTWQTPVERLIDIYEWLVDNENEIFEE